MTVSIPSVPWHTPALWLEANESLKQILHHKRHAVDASLHLARQLQAQFTMQI